MVQIEGDIVIGRPVEEVFDFVADEQNEPRYNPRLLYARQATPGAIGVGTRFDAATMMMGRAVPMTIKITGFDRPQRLASSTRLASMDVDGTLTFEPAPFGTRLQGWWRLRPQGLLKLVTPFVAKMGQRQELAIWSSLKR